MNSVNVLISPLYRSSKGEEEREGDSMDINDAILLGTLAKKPWL